MSGGDTVKTGTLEDLNPKGSESRRFLRVFFGRWLVIVGMILVLATLVLAIFAPLLAPYPPNEQSLSERLMQPNSKHLLGTDSLGRDTLSRVVYGSQASLLVAAGSLLGATIIGVLLGLLAGYFGGWTFTVIMRLMDPLMAFPPIMLGLVISGLLGSGITNVVIAIGIGLVPGFARIMCAQVLTIKENDYISASVSIGSSNWRTMLYHIVPNSFPPLIVQISLWVGVAILAEASLSFLGVGIKPPTAAWGSMISDGYKYLLSNPMLSIAPGVAIMLAVFGFNMMGDGFRDALDPKLRGKI